MTIGSSLEARRKEITIALRTTRDEDKEEGYRQACHERLGAWHCHSPAFLFASRLKVIGVLS
jgi:hypothetical protein